MYYGIRINDRFFKGYVYLDNKNKGRYAGNTQLGSNLQDGDIVDIITTELPERTEVTRSIGGYYINISRDRSIEGKDY